MHAHPCVLTDACQMWRHKSGWWNISPPLPPLHPPLLNWFTCQTHWRLCPLSFFFIGCNITKFLPSLLGATEIWKKGHFRQDGCLVSAYGFNIFRGFFSAMALEETFANLEDEKVHRRRIDEVVGKNPAHCRLNFAVIVRISTLKSRPSTLLTSNRENFKSALKLHRIPQALF